MTPHPRFVRRRFAAHARPAAGEREASYLAEFFTPIRRFRANLGPIVSLAIGLVLASTAVP